MERSFAVTTSDCNVVGCNLRPKSWGVIYESAHCDQKHRTKTLQIPLEQRRGWEVRKVLPLRYRFAELNAVTEEFTTANAQSEKTSVWMRWWIQNGENPHHFEEECKELCGLLTWMTHTNRDVTVVSLSCTCHGNSWFRLISSRPFSAQKRVHAFLSEPSQTEMDRLSSSTCLFLSND